MPNEPIQPGRLLPDERDQAKANPLYQQTAVSVDAGAADKLRSTKQLTELPQEDLQELADELGLDRSRYHSRHELILAIHQRRQVIARMDRQAMLEVIQWGRRTVPTNATLLQIANEITRIHSMRFSGLSERGLVILAVLRNVKLNGTESVPELVKKLKKQEGLFAKLNRKRRAMMGSIVSNMIGEEQSAEPQEPAAPKSSNGTKSSSAMATTSDSGTIRDEIEDAGLFGGIAGRIKKTADQYLNQKLDEIEARIDRKLDEIDRRLAEWRDKEIANRIRILKITLWASVIVAALALVYSYIKVYIVGDMTRDPSPTQQVDTRK